MSADPSGGLSTASLAVHLGRPDRLPGGPVNPDITLSSTYHQGGQLTYGRDGNPTWAALEAAIGGLEGGSAVTFSSGMAAITAVVEMLPVPGRVVVAADAYNGTRRFLADVASRGRLRYATTDIADIDGCLATCRDLVAGPGRPSGSPGDFGAGGLLWLESPTNPLLRIADIAALSAGAHELGMHVVVDNTFASPVLQRPLDLGADIVVHSATKLLSGHSDVVLGAAVTASEDVLGGLRTRRSLHGGAPGPVEAWLALRGLRTLALRVAASSASAATLAARLLGHPATGAVRYPGLPDHPGHALAARQMRGFGPMLAFEVLSGADAADAVVAACRLATPGTSLGGVETLIERRGRWPGEEGTPPGLIRLAVGIEDVEDLWADLDAALATARP